MNAEEWLDTLPPDHPTRISHRALAIELRSNPGRYRRVGAYASRDGAAGVASIIRTGRRPAWRRVPGGHYDAEVRTTRTGRHYVFARWIAVPEPSRRTA